MFSNQKKRFFEKKGFYVLLAAILAFGWWMNQDPNDNTGLTGELPTDVVQSVGSDEEDKQSTINKKNNSETDNNDIIPGEKDDVNSTFDEYYLVKEIDGIIKVFHYDQAGNEQLLQNTDIAFSLISESDQHMFSEGMVLENEEELLNLLQDFES